MTALSPVISSSHRRSLFNEALKAHLIEDLGQSFVLFADQKAVGVCSFMNVEKTAYLSFFFDPDTPYRTRCHLLGTIDERIVRMYHPEAILSWSDDPQSMRALRGCLYFKAGKWMKRPVEKWRQQLSDRCFDEDGYLINQGLMKDLPFGWFETEEKGCGWIAAYNLLKWAGKEAFLQETAEGLGEHALFGEVGGENIINLRSYLERQGLDIHLRTGLKDSLIRKMNESQAGILLYSHVYGSHFAAYEKQQDGKFHFWNAVYGKRHDVIAIEQFYKERVLWPLGTVLYLL